MGHMYAAIKGRYDVDLFNLQCTMRCTYIVNLLGLSTRAKPTVVQISESECDEMKNRLRSLHEAAEEKEETLKKYEACLAQQ